MPGVMAAQVPSVLSKYLLTQSLVVAATVQRAGQDQLTQRTLAGRGVGPTGRDIRRGDLDTGVGVPHHLRSLQQLRERSGGRRVGESLQGHGHRSVVRHGVLGSQSPNLGEDRLDTLRIVGPAQGHDKTVHRAHAGPVLTHTRVLPALVPLARPDGLNERLGPCGVAHDAEDMSIRQPVLFRVGVPVRLSQQRKGLLALCEDNLDPFELIREGPDGLCHSLRRQREGVLVRKDLLRQVPLLHQMLLQRTDIDLPQSLARMSGRRGGQTRRITLVLNIGLHPNDRHHVAMRADGPGP